MKLFYNFYNIIFDVTPVIRILLFKYFLNCFTVSHWYFCEKVVLSFSNEIITVSTTVNCDFFQVVSDLFIMS